eukprot:TRINITY_DN25894_c0_g1_i2.p1 TRINITY_DN25894_c0_g1~~TRINITY_DN25894_c0_g1_i2.p1  ORF type:complete len:710 (-),score=105.56 TRINITY_DN25894_c0_g1_i2:84-2213(-)
MEMTSNSSEVKIIGPPVPVNEIIEITGSEGEFVEGKPATIYIPFHTNPPAEKVWLFPSDIAPNYLEINKTTTNSTFGRYSTAGIIYESEKPVRSNGERSYLTVLRISELELDDSNLQHRMIVNNDIANTTYDFKITNIEGEECPQSLNNGLEMSQLPNITVHPGTDVTFMIKWDPEFTDYRYEISEVRVQPPNHVKEDESFIFSTPLITCVNTAKDTINTDGDGDGRPRTMECDTKGDEDNQNIQLTLKNPTQYDSGDFIFQISVSRNGGKTMCPLSAVKNIVVYRPPSEMQLYGLENNLMYTTPERTQSVSCQVGYMRPLQNLTFQWFLNDMSMNDVVSVCNDIHVDNITISEEDRTETLVGEVFNVASIIKFPVRREYDDMDVFCKVTNDDFSIDMTSDIANLQITGPPVPANGIISISGDFKKGESTIMYIPFHSNPPAVKVWLFMSDIYPDYLEINPDLPSTSKGRYTTQGIIKKNEKPDRSTGDRSYYVVMKLSEFEEGDSERQHIMIVNNGIGNTTFTFRISHVQGDSGAKLSWSEIAVIVIGILVGIILIVGVSVMAVSFMKTKKKPRKEKDERRKQRKDKVSLSRSDGRASSEYDDQRDRSPPPPKHNREYDERHSKKASAPGYNNRGYHSGEDNQAWNSKNKNQGGRENKTGKYKNDDQPYKRDRNGYNSFLGYSGSKGEEQRGFSHQEPWQQHQIPRMK